MPITLITGPANAGKAREVMSSVRRHLVHGEDPLLVVPTRADVEHYRGELAREGIVLGARVERFEGLIGTVVRCAGTGGVLLGRLAREQVLARIVSQRVANGGFAAAGRSSSPGSVLSIGQGRNTHGFVRSLAALVGELEAQRVTPARLEAALRTWETADGMRAAEGAEDLGKLFGEYRRVLKQIGRIDPERRTAKALDALRREPALWGGTPVLIYGFDDFDELQLDTIETLGAVVGAPVTVSLT